MERPGARGKDADPTVGMRFDVEIAKAQARTDKLAEGMSALLAEINRLSTIRAAKARQASWEESYPPDAKPDSIGARIAAVIRGATS